MYRVVVERSAEKDLRKLQLDVRFRVADALRSFANDPRPVGSRKLAGTKHDWRVRVGDYRIIYEIADAIRVVRIYRVRHRAKPIAFFPRPREAERFTRAFGVGILANGKAVGAVIPFTPPAIQDAQVETPMAAPFHAARSRCFQGPAGRIQPNIAAGNHLPSHMHIVILQENQAALQVAVFA